MLVTSDGNDCDPSYVNRIICLRTGALITLPLSKVIHIFVLLVLLDHIILVVLHIYI